MSQIFSTNPERKRKFALCAGYFDTNELLTRNNLEGPLSATGPVHEEDPIKRIHGSGLLNFEILSNQVMLVPGTV